MSHSRAIRRFGDREPRLVRSVAALLSLLAAALVATACASSPGGNPFSGGGAGGESRTLEIDVSNLNFNDATLHAISGSGRRRVGRVSGKSEGSFRIPFEHEQSLRIEIDLLAGADHTTNAVSVGPGDRVRLVIQPELRRSYLQR